MLPKVKINFANGAIGSVAEMEDGVVGLLATAVAVPSKFELDKPYLITSLDDLAALGIDNKSAGANKNVYKCVSDYYTEAGVGSKLWLMGVADTESIDTIVDVDESYGKNLLQAANGAIRILMVKITDPASYSATPTGGLDSKVKTAISNAQELAEWATNEMYAPCMVLLEGRHYTGTPTDLTSLKTMANNRVAVVIGDSVKDSTGAAVGLVAGRLSSIPVQRSLARVRTGAIKSDEMYIGSDVAETAHPDLIHDAGYICPRTFVGKAGYYWSDDNLATSDTDDYAIIPRRRVIDKAYRVAYETLVNELADEVAVNNNGEISAPVLKSLEAMVVNAIANSMTSEGNLSTDTSDPNDLGVLCTIPASQNIVATNKLMVNLKVRPYGYAKYIDVNLGFQTL